MNPRNNGIILVALFVGICTYLHCSKTSNNNPIDPEYIGTYSLNVKLSSFGDTALEVFQRYALVCSTGVDTFSAYSFTQAFDSMAVVDGFATPRKQGFDTVFFRCIRPFNGNVNIKGIRPNEDSVVTGVALHIVNNYAIKGDRAAVATVPDSFRIKYSGPHEMASTLRVKWSMTPLKLDTVLPVSAPFIVIPPMTAGNNQILKAALMDEAGRFCPLDSFLITIKKTIPPALDSGSVALQAVLGAPLSLIFNHAGNGLPSYSVCFYLDTMHDSVFIAIPKAIDTVIFNKQVRDTGNKTFTVYLVNEAGKSNEIKKSVSIAYTLPSVFFTGETLVVSFNKFSPITFSSEPPAVSYIWNIDSLPTQSTDSSNIELKLPDSGFHTLYVYGTDQYGYRGKTASIPVHARKFDFDIKPSEFPTEVKARSWIRWIAGVDDESKAKSRNVKYKWVITPQKYDSIKTTGVRNDTLRLFWRDTANVVIGITPSDDSAGTFAPFGKNVSVKRFAPRLMFKDRTVSMKTTDSVWCAVSVADSNIGGQVDSIFWFRSGKNQAAFGNHDTVMMVKSTVPDTFWISAYAQDNDGFPSKKDSIRFFVQAFQPYILPQMSDTVVFVNTPFTFSASGHVSDSSATIAMYYWDFDGNGTWDDSSSVKTLVHTFATIGTFSVIVKCKDNKGSPSIPDTFKVTVTKGEPSVTGISPRTVWFGDNALYTVSAKTGKTNDSIVGYFVSWNNSDSFLTYTTKSINYMFADSGRHIIKLYVKSKEGLVSETRSDTIYVDPDKPVIDSLKLEAAAGVVFVFDPCSLRIFGHTSHDTIDSFAVQWGDGSPKIVQKGKVFSHTYGHPDPYTISAAARNSRGFWSEPMTKQVPVRLGQPVVDSIFPAAIWVGDDTTFTVSAHDTNGTVDSIIINWGDGNAVRRLRTEAIHHKYDISQSGQKFVKVLCKDNDGIFSDTVSFSINVKLGKPVFAQIKTDSALSRIFVRDTVRYTVKGIDPNGHIDSVLVSWNGGTQFERVMAVKDSVCIAHAFARTESGPRNVLFRLVDDDGLTTDSTIAITVLSGAPRVDSMVVDTGRGNVFVNDKGKYSEYVSDVNGTIRKMFASWDNDSITADTSFDVSFASGAGYFSHVYDTTKSGWQYMWFWAMDEDSIMTPKKKDSVMVHLAPPVLWGDKIDTLWVPVSAAGTYYIHVNSFDTNGVNNLPVKWYWNATASLTGATVTSVDSVPIDIMQGMNPFPIGSPQTRYIAARDNDSLLTRVIKSFQVYADSAPPTPSIVADKVGSVVTILWKNKDAKDGDATQYKIIIKKDSSPTITDILVDYKAGSQYDAGTSGYDFKYSFTPTTGSGTYSYKVIAKDARGSENSSIEGAFIYP
jgi:hypothetical protein